jgi:WD40 repeat protein
MNSFDRLTNDGGQKFSPQFTNQDEIIYTLFDGATLMRSMRLRMRPRNAEPIHKEESRSELDTVMSTDGRYLACVKLRGALSLGLQILNVKENTVVEVRPEPGFCGFRSPAIAPDNSRVMFSYAAGSLQKLYSVDMRGGDRLKLTDGPGVDNWPDYSPDGGHVVFSSSRGGRFDIYSMKADGSEVRRLTDGPYRNVRPRFSPDGNHIAYASFRDDRSRVCVMKSDGSSKQYLETPSEGDDYPNWHPTGNSLAVVSEYGGCHDLYLLSLKL